MTSVHSDPRIPPPERCVLRAMLDHWAQLQPDQVFAVFEDQPAWTWAATRRAVRLRARALQALGVRQGDHVLVFLPNSPECLVSWLAINYLGAVYVPMNTAYRGAILQHAIALSDARLVIAHAELVPRLAEVDPGPLRTVECVGGMPATRPPGVPVVAAQMAPADGADADEALELQRPPRPWDTQCLMFTSGTTGPSKAVMTSYLQLYESGHCLPQARADDRMLISLPLFHAGSTLGVYRMLSLGASIALVSAFKTDSFWQTIERTRATGLILIGVMASFIVRNFSAQDVVPTTLRWALAGPLNEDALEFGRRFGVRINTGFNMTEIASPLVSGTEGLQPGSCGRPRAGVQVRIVDDDDLEVPPGAPGELVLRTDVPWTITTGYYKNPEATARAWRNGWFHTGDAFRQSADGDLFFVDRMKDAIRRRGENISSFEVEAQVLRFAGIQEAAAVAVPDAMAEDEVLVAVAPKPGAQIDGGELVRFLARELPHFMVPRYVRVLPELPKTPSQKVEKHKLRAEGVTPDTWDRVAAGVVVQR